MTLAVIADLHGNLTALEVAEDGLEGANPDALVCLGDVGSFGPQPRETLRRVQALGCPVVLGNADAELLNPPVATDPSTELIAWCAAQLTDDDRAFITTFAPTLELELDGVRVLCAHGSPRSFDDVITATTPETDVTGWLLGTDAQLICVGHTHTPLLRRSQDKLIINPGSVGLPYEHSGGSARNPPWAEYALVESLHHQPSVTFRRVPYDTGRLAQVAHERAMPHATWWSEGWTR